MQRRRGNGVTSNIKLKQRAKKEWKKKTESKNEDNG